ncbi:fimbrial protein [Mixta tenebrionis]|uniref:Type 1 fimbrial protein n=1 Tax=Mixta tenebrionis TaxID=2562439 RepID=A0A506V4C0_9GAMM|nr:MULTISPECIES: fimbrial protein [Mixta]QHM77553.1 Major fimbrial subunit SMF-1 [Mixta theicola]TPW40714.1 type 1 fimbrial protein [Mixta tenebrionis]
MKKTLLGTIVAVAFSSAVLPASASNGTITINGKIESNTCVAKVNGTNKDATVTLNPLNASSLATAGATAGYASFTIALTDCGTATNKVNAFFEPGSTVDMDTGYLNNVAATTPAQNVQIQLLNKNGGVIQVGDAESARVVQETIANGTATMKYGVRYFAKGAVTGGNVSTNVTYSIEYN